jgi:hypothetical protein
MPFPVHNHGFRVAFQKPVKSKILQILALCLLCILQRPSIAFSQEKVDRRILFETIFKGYSLYISALKAELDPELDPFEKQFLDYLVSWTADYANQNELIFRDDPHEFIIDPAQPPRTARTTISLIAPVFINLAIINDPHTKWTLADAFQIYVHEMGHKVSYQFRTDYRDITAPLSPEDQARVDRVGAKLRAVFEKHLHVIETADGQQIEVLHFPLQAQASDGYRVRHMRPWNLDLGPYQVRLLVHSPSKVTDLTDSVFQALEKVPRLMSADNSQKYILTGLLDKWTVFESFQVIPSGKASYELRLVLHELFYDGQGPPDSKIGEYTRAEIDEAFNQGAHRLQQTLRFSMDLKASSQNTFRQLPTSLQALDHEAQVVKYKIDGRHFSFTFKVNNPLSQNTKVYLRGISDNDVFIFPAKLIAKTDKEATYEVRELIPSHSNANSLRFESIQIKNGNSSKVIDLDQSEKLELTPQQVRAPQILSAKIEGQKLKLTVQSDFPLQSLRLQVDEARLRNVDSKTLKHQFRRELRTQIELSRKEFQQTRQGSIIQVTADLPGAQMDAIDFENPIPGLGHNEHGWVLYDTGVKFEIPGPNLDLSSIHVVDQQLNLSPENSITLRYAVPTKKKVKSPNLCRSVHSRS